MRAASCRRDELGEHANQVLGLRMGQNRDLIGTVEDGGEEEQDAVRRNHIFSARVDRQSQQISSTHEWISDASDFHLKLMAEFKSGLRGGWRATHDLSEMVEH